MGLFSKDKKEDKTEVKDAVVESKDSDVKVSETQTGAFLEEMIIAPIITEKSHGLSKLGKYVFRIAPNATKRSVRLAVAAAYKVDVESVNIVSMPGRRRTVKYNRGFTTPYRKAIVTVKKGQAIPLFETA